MVAEHWNLTYLHYDDLTWFAGYNSSTFGVISMCICPQVLILVFSRSGVSSNFTMKGADVTLDPFLSFRKELKGKLIDSSGGNRLINLVFRVMAITKSAKNIPSLLPPLPFPPAPYVL
ncbi:hypothetical protein LIER_13693 [Lithospermum erythrorhizon]|uniref:Uncharacterized protein n=1 Tax=Lithospermum erythrorhizon TaxID=34254 RepID=A0AAV3PX85_LITER